MTHKLLLQKHCFLRFEDNLVNTEELLKEANAENGYTPFVDQIHNKIIPGWYYKEATAEHPTALHLRDVYSKLFNLSGLRARFYDQIPGYNIDFHKDRGTICSFNFLLEGNYDPVIFGAPGIRYNCLYKFALLNTQVHHAVMNIKVRRRLFKLSVYDKSFEEIASVLPNVLSSRQAKT